MGGEFTKLGALWIKNGAKGEFWAGNVEIDGEKHNIIVFTNNRKQQPKHPDLIIYEQQDGPGF